MYVDNERMSQSSISHITLALPKPQIQDDESNNSESAFSDELSSQNNSVSSYSQQRRISKKKFSMVVEDQMIM